MRKRRWSDLSPRTRRLVKWGAAFEGVLKVLALIDLAQRPADQVRGSKVRWVVAIVLANSLGVVPLTYFLRGRRVAPADS